MLSKSRKHNRKVVKSDWKIIQSLMAYKSRVVFLNPKDTSKGCSRCGKINAPKGAYECGLRMDRQLNAVINLYLQMEGPSPSPRLFEELMTWSGFALTGADDREAGESQGLSMDILIHT
ncbi:MAG: zinc ribbon domain-containing protein [Candidatus Korarchaeum sp.]